MIDRLISGKSDLKRIVGIEPNGSSAEIFIQKENGEIENKIVPNKYWILFKDKIDSQCVRLKGNLHYKWGKQYTDHKKFLKERYIYKPREPYSVYEPKEALMIKDGYCYYQGMKHNEVSILSFDIETTGLDGFKEELLLISNTYRDYKGNITRKLFNYENYKNGSEMVLDWCSWVRNSISPSIIVGHNIIPFDLPFLHNYCDKFGHGLPLGRDGSEIEIKNYQSFFRIDGSREQAYKKISCYGREIVDTYFLSIKYDIGKKYESYGLKNIIKQEGLEVKNRVFYDASQIRINYKNPVEWEKIKEYCKFDSDDGLNLYDLVSPSFFYLTQSVPKPFQSMVESASGSQINAMLVRSYLQEAHSIPKANKIEDHVQGGISFGVPGVYRNMVKIDLKSAYPSQILRFKLYDAEKDPEGNFYKLVEFFTLQRFDLKEKYKETNDRYYLDMEQAGKIFINSAYGSTITPGLNFNSIQLGAKITYETREVIRMSLMWASGKDLDYWLNLFKEKTL